MSTHHGILLHIVFSTKYRRPVIADSWRDDLFAYIGGTVKDHKATLLKAGGIEDHVHLLLRIHPEYAIPKTVQLLKTNSSKWINDTEKTSIPFQWQRGYGTFSVSQSMSNTVKRYIFRQRQHHNRRTGDRRVNIPNSADRQALIKALSEVLPIRSVTTWLQTPNDAFDGLKPIELIDRGESDRLWEMIFNLRSGNPA